MIHQMCSVSFDLFVGSDGAEDDLGETLTGEHAETDPADRTPVLYKCKRLVLRIEHQSRNS